MVDLLVARGIRDGNVLDAMETVKRHLYIPSNQLQLVDPYGDHPCSIGFGQTISQPYIVAYMVEKLCLIPGCKVLEIGSGSGYQAAVLFEMGMNVYTIESVNELYDHCTGVLNPSVHLRNGDGYEGWPEEAPFTGIILSCAPGSIPSNLVEQLAEGGRMILPVGSIFQQLVIISKLSGRVSMEMDLPVRFVPMVKNS